MKILVVSDTHRRDLMFKEAYVREEPVDMVIHCGDIEGSEDYIKEIADCPVEMVMGNNDFFSYLPREKEFMIGKYKVWITHGHYFNVSLGRERLKEEAKFRGVDIVMYGHTHRPVIDYDGDLTVINPGSLGYPRQEGRRPSYIVMETDRDGDAHFTIHYL